MPAPRPMFRPRSAPLSALLCGAVLALAAPWSAAAAQEPTPPDSAAAPATPADTTGAITGEVKDPDGKPIADVDIVLIGTARRTRTDQQGRFAFGELKPGDYELLFRKIGYQPTDGVLFINPGRVFNLGIVLAPRTQLERVVITAEVFNEIAGVVTDTVGTPIPGATVAIGGDRTYGTDEAGRFLFANVTPGKWLLRVTKPGYEPRVVGLQMLAQLERSLTIKLTPESEPQPRNAEAVWQEHEQRRAFMAGTASEVVTREELARYGAIGLDFIIPRVAPRAYAAIVQAFGTSRGPSSFGFSQGGNSTMQAVAGAACLLYDGIDPVWNQPLASVSAAQVESIEIIVPDADQTRTACARFPVQSPCNCATSNRTPAILVIWRR